MVRILMSGCNGRMGQVITELVRENKQLKIVAGIAHKQLKIVAGFDKIDNRDNGYPVFSVPEAINVEFDVIIDFSNSEAMDTVISIALLKKSPLVYATTGLTKDQVKVLKETAKEIPIFYSANMSLGVNLIIDLVKKATKILEGNFDIEIVEKHHNQKLDAPSGTALAIADAINGALSERHEYVFDRHSMRKKRSKTEIGIHAVRGGTIVGDHAIIFAGTDEVIEFKHSAMSKNIFGVGALKAAQFMCGKRPGLYAMSDMIEEG